MPGRALRLALSLLLAALVTQSTVFAAGHSRSIPRPNVPLLGWYTSIGPDLANNNLAGYHRTGMSVVVATTVPDQSYTAAFLDRALQAGVRVLLQPDNNWIRNGDWSALASFVRRFRSSPAVYGWYLFDEPDFNSLPPAQLIKAYRLVKSLDRRHPVAVVFTIGNCNFGRGLDRRYLAGFDLLMFDEYPFYTFVRGRAESQDGIRQFQTAARDCVAAAHRFHKQGPIMVEQSFGNGIHDGPFMFRDPTYSEEASMFAGAVKAGARGILFFHDQYADHHMRLAVHAIVSNWYRTIPRRFRPHLPMPESVTPSAPSGSSSAQAPPAPAASSSTHASARAHAPAARVPRSSPFESAFPRPAAPATPSGPPDPALPNCPAAASCPS